MRNFQQIVLEPTHVHGNTLDLVLTTNSDRLQNLNVSDIGANSFNSDHHLIWFNLISRSCLGRVSIADSVYNYTKGNHSEMDCYFMEKHFNTTSANSDELWTSLKSFNFKVINKYSKWFNPDIKYDLNYIHSLRQRVKKSYCNQKKWIVFFGTWAPSPNDPWEGNLWSKFNCSISTQAIGSLLTYTTTV